MKQNQTCTCDSPLISYAGSWKAEDGNISSTQVSPTSVRMVSRSNGDAASFNFTGTAIWIYPATNQSHGSYDVYLDGALSRFNASTSVSTSAPLFQTMGLQCIPHVLSIHNTGTNVTANPSYLDLDTIVWEERDRYGNASGLSTAGDDNTSPKFGWYPFDEWMTQSRIVPEDSGEGVLNVTVTFHVTNSSDAWMQYNFSGNAISIFGIVGPSQGPYSALLNYIPDEDDTNNHQHDDSFDLPPEQFLNASFPFNRTGVLLFHASNINASRITTLTMKNHPDKQGDSLSIAYSVLATYDTRTTLPNESHVGIPVGAMVAAVLCPIALVVLLALGVYSLQRRRQGKLIRQQKMNLFKDSLAKRGVLPGSEPPKKDDLEQRRPSLDHGL